MCFQVNIVGASENAGGEVSIDKIQNGSDYRVITIDKNYTGSIDEIWHWTMNSVESVNVDKDNPKMEFYFQKTKRLYFIIQDKRILVVAIPSLKQLRK